MLTITLAEIMLSLLGLWWWLRLGSASRVCASRQRVKATKFELISDSP